MVKSLAQHLFGSLRIFRSFRHDAVSVGICIALLICILRVDKDEFTSLDSIARKRKYKCRFVYRTQMLIHGPRSMERKDITADLTCRIGPFH